VNRQLLRLLSSHILVWNWPEFNPDLKVTKILYHCFLLLDWFRFWETHLTTYQRFVAGQSAIIPSLGGQLGTVWLNDSTARRCCVWWLGSIDSAVHQRVREMASYWGCRRMACYMLYKTTPACVCAFVLLVFVSVSGLPDCQNLPCGLAFRDHIVHLNESLSNV